jgi:hypothetical protein
MTPEIQNARRKALELVLAAKETDRKVWNVELGEILVQVIAEDPEWTLRTDRDRERRMYHLLHQLSS